MKNLWPRFFSYVQSAGFYEEIHRRAVHLLPEGNGRTWFDVGTGPGLVARLAAAHGYRTTGFDVNAAMIEEARANSRHLPAPNEFEICGLDELAASVRKADVVSAASLLAVLRDKDGGLRRLMACVKEGGALLVIETTARMKPPAALAWLMRNGIRKRNWVLLLWAWARADQRPIDFAALGRQGYQIEHIDLFGKLVSAWIIRHKAISMPGD